MSEADTGHTYPSERCGIHLRRGLEWACLDAVITFPRSRRGRRWCLAHDEGSARPRSAIEGFRPRRRFAHDAPDIDDWPHARGFGPWRQRCPERRSCEWWIPTRTHCGSV